jgi:hypothetical protein
VANGLLPLSPIAPDIGRAEERGGRRRELVRLVVLDRYGADENVVRITLDDRAVLVGVLLVVLILLFPGIRR